MSFRSIPLLHESQPNRLHDFSVLFTITARTLPLQDSQDEALQPYHLSQFPGSEVKGLFFFYYLKSTYSEGKGTQIPEDFAK